MEQGDGDALVHRNDLGVAQGRRKPLAEGGKGFPEPPPGGVVSHNHGIPGRLRVGIGFRVGVVGAHRGDQAPHRRRNLQARVNLDAARPAPTGVQRRLGHEVVSPGNPPGHLHPDAGGSMHQETGRVEGPAARAPAECDPVQSAGDARPGVGRPEAFRGFDLASGSRQVPASQKGSVQGGDPGKETGVRMVSVRRRSRVQQGLHLPGGLRRLTARRGVREGVEPTVERRTRGNGLQAVARGLLRREEAPDARVSEGIAVRVAFQHRVDDVVRQIPHARRLRLFPDGQVDPGQIATGVVLQGAHQQRDLIPAVQPQPLAGADGPVFVFQAPRGQDALQSRLAELQDPLDAVAAVQVGILHPRFHSHRQFLRGAPAHPDPALPGGMRHHRPGRNRARDLPNLIPGVGHQVGVS